MLFVTVGSEEEFSPNPPQVLFSGRFDVSGNGHQHYDVSPDRETFAMIRLGEGVPQVSLNVILNWKPEVERFLSRD